MIKVIAVDLGGVYFFWNYDDYCASMSKACNKDFRMIKTVLNKKIREAHVRKISDRDYWKYFCKNTKAKISYNDFESITLKHYKPNKPVINLMKKLRKKYKIALIANQTPVVEKIEKRYKFYKNFDFNLSSYIVKMQKPHKNIFNFLIKKAKCKPEEIIFIDDKNSNLVPAKQLGIKTILFKNLNQLKKELNNFGVKC